MNHEEMHPGFHKFHLNMYGEMGWPIRPVIHVLSVPDFGYPHSHQSKMEIFILHGGYTAEEYSLMSDNGWVMRRAQYRKGMYYVIQPSLIHKIVEIHDGPCITVSIAGPNVKEQLFWRDNGGKLESYTHPPQHRDPS